jgi:hypothetical protein
MASDSTPLREWLVIAPDFPGALEKRLAVRPQHMGGLKEDPETFWLFGGMLLFFAFNAVPLHAPERAVKREGEC